MVAKKSLLIACSGDGSTKYLLIAYIGDGSKNVY